MKKAVIITVAILAAVGVAIAGYSVYYKQRVY